MGCGRFSAEELPVAVFRCFYVRTPRCEDLQNASEYGIVIKVKTLLSGFGLISRTREFSCSVFTAFHF